MNKIIFIVASLFALTAFEAHSHGERGGMVEAKAWPVAEYVSQEGETREEFVIRVAELLQKWTNENGVEACGFLASNGNTWGVKLLTLRNQISCIPDPRYVPAGMKAQDDTIHSHPNPEEDGYIYLNKATLDSLLAMGDNTFHRTRKRNPRVKAQYDFSSSDFKAGPGYMVMNGKLMYQKGRRNVEDLGMLPGY